MNFENIVIHTHIHTRAHTQAHIKNYRYHLMAEVNGLRGPRLFGFGSGSWFVSKAYSLLVFYSFEGGEGG